MKSTCTIFVASLLAIPAWSGENPIPTPLRADRYAGMGGKSPFALATPAGPASAPQAPFAANWYVSGVARLGDVNFVTVKARDLSAQFSLFGNERHPETGVSLASVNWSDTIGKSTVILRKGTETAMLEFNEAEMRGPQLAPAAPGATPEAKAAGSPPSGLRPRPTAPVSAPVPISPTLVVPAQTAAQFPPAAIAGTPEVRRRVRLIKSPP